MSDLERLDTALDAEYRLRLTLRAFRDSEYANEPVIPEWIKHLSDNDVKALCGLAQEEGLRRGWDSYWWECGWDYEDE